MNETGYPKKYITLKKQERLLENIIWFSNIKKFDKIYFEDLKSQRSVNSHHLYKSGIFYSGKCKRNIQYESGIELNFIQDLELMPCVRYYYEQPIQLEYRIKRKLRKYTPDFIVFLVTGEVFVVEIKDLNQMLDLRVQRKMEVLCDFCKERGFGILFTNGRSTIDSILSDNYNKKFEKDILDSLDNNKCLRFYDFEEIRNKHNARLMDLLNIVIKNNLNYKSYPFKLTRSKLGYNKFRDVFINHEQNKDYLSDMLKTNWF